MHLRRRRPDVALQPQRLGRQDADPAPHSLRRGERRRRRRDRRGAARHPRHRDFAGAGAGRPGRRDPVDREHRRPLRVAGFQPVLRHPLRLRAVEDRLSRLARLARRATHGAWPANIPDTAQRAYGLGEIKGWLEVFLRRFFEQSQFKRSALPNGPKISSGGSLSPRGDWRAPSDSHAAVWLAELDANVPDKE